MNGLQLQWFVLTFLVFNTVYGNKMCDLDNEECLTQAARNIYQTMISTFKDSTDPLTQKKIEQQLDGFRYKLTNVKLVGIRNCNVMRLTISPKESMFGYYLRCPQLVLTADFETSGTIGTLPFDGKGETKITIEDYIAAWKGLYEKFIDEKDQKEHPLVKDFTVEVEPKGKITFEVTNLLPGVTANFDEINSYLNQNWQQIEKMTRTAFVDGTFRKFYQNFSDACKKFPLEVIFSAE